jgi:Photosynthetic reaction centre cytochrome C subunit
MTNRQIVSFGILALCILITLPLVLVAQGQREGGKKGAPAPLENLQVLPKTMERPQVVMLMQNINKALGVQCNYCHVEREGAQPGPNGQIPIDPPKDDKDTKKKARVMMRMVGQINMTLASEMGKPAAELQRVQCATCHRGSAIPKVD